MNKQYWWAKVKETKKIWKSLKDELMYLIDSRVTFKLNLISSHNDETSCFYLFNSNSTYKDWSISLMLENIYRTYSDDVNTYLFSENERFGSRLREANYTIDILTEEEFNNLIQ